MFSNKHFHRILSLQHVRKPNYLKLFNENVIELIFVNIVLSKYIDLQASGVQ